MQVEYSENILFPYKIDIFVLILIVRGINYHIFVLNIKIFTTLCFFTQNLKVLYKLIK